MADFLPGKFLNPMRDQLAADWRRDVAFRNPGADVGPGSQPWLDSLVATDAILPLYTRSNDIANGTNWTSSSGDALRVWLQSMGTDFLPAVGALGFIQIGASVGGTVIQAGDQGKINGFTYRAISGGLYSDGSQVGIIGVDTGPQTDQPAGAIFQWSAPRPGCNPNATVVARPDGTGLIGGSNVETDDKAKARLSDLKNDPPGTGNDAHIRSIVMNTPGLSIQAVFTFPACMGNGTTGVTFTMRPAELGANRLPTPDELTLALGYLQGAGAGQLGATDSIFMIALTSSLLGMVFKVSWAPGATGWADSSPFPLYESPGANWAVTSFVVPTPTTFNLAASGSTQVPQVGQSLGFFDAAAQVFRRKRILTATAAGLGYTITVDTSNGVSDTTFTPPSGAVASPWSDSLDSIIAPVLAYLDAIGPGEMFPSFFDLGLRQKRCPASPSQWASVVGNRILGGPPNASQPFDPNAPATPTLLSTSTLGDIELVEPSPPYQTPVGYPGVSVNQIVLSSLACFPE